MANDLKSGLVALLRSSQANPSGHRDHTFAHHQVFHGQMRLNDLEDLVREPVRLQQAAELQQRRLVRRGLAGQIDADEGADRLAVVDRVLAPLVRQAEALLRNIHPQHPSHPDRWPATALTLRVKRLNLRL